MYIWHTITIILSICSWKALADTPANCTFEDIRGYWLFEESEPINDRNEDCDRVTSYPRQVYIHLDYPNNATDKFGNRGKWTIIYNQGFEVIINYRRYFAFSQYHRDGNGVVSDCHKIKPGWSHDVLGNNWACYKGHKVNDWQNAALKSQQSKKHPNKPLYLESVNPKKTFSQQQVDEINSRQKLWKARVYSEFQSMTTDELIQMAGGKGSVIASRPKSAPVTEEVRKMADSLPKSFDWRDVNGVDYVSPVRNQGRCGSCYIFSSMAQLESRIRIATNNTQKPVFSPQEVLDCSQYSQGCSGGFPYLIGGKYAQDYGIVEESCYPYKGIEGMCNKHFNSTCKRRTYTVRYHYVGGYYGGCNEELMKLELVRNGPIAVAFEVYPDFYQYHSGVYVHSSDSIKAEAGFNPFELTNHAVVVVGYGVDEQTNEKYWIVKNSWGTHWGLGGYFKIRRGTDECGIESLAVAATPIPY